MLLTTRFSKFHQHFEITNHVQFGGNNRGPCPSCVSMGKNNNQDNLSLLPSGAYHCHRGCTRDEIRMACGWPPSSGWSGIPRRREKTARREDPEKPIVERTVDEDAVATATARLSETGSEDATKAREWLEARGISAEMRRRHRIGLGRVRHEKASTMQPMGREKAPTRAPSDTFHPAISLFIPHPTNPGQYFEKKRPAPWLPPAERPRGLPKWKQYGVPATLWVVHSPPAAKETWVVEGEWDAMVLAELVRSSGDAIAVCTGTAGAGTPPRAEELRRITTGKVTLWFDRNDAEVSGKRAGEQGALKWADRLEALGKSVAVGLVPMPEGCEVEGWDVTNAIQHGYTYEDFAKESAVMHIEEFRRQLMKREFQAKYPERLKEAQEELRGRRTQPEADADKVGRKQTTPPKPSDVARHLAETFRDRLAWHTQEEAWYHYESEFPGVWSEEDPVTVGQIVETRLFDAIGPIYSGHYVMDVLRVLKWLLNRPHWTQADHLLPLIDGVLDKRSLELTPHSPTYNLTWSLPIRWSERHMGCEPIKEWIAESMLGDPLLVQVLRAILNAVVYKRSNLHRYVQLVGPGGSGKGTFFRLAMALVGQRNFLTTTRKQLEEGRFELAALKDLMLLLITDADNYTGESSMLKALTGGDPLRMEQKGKQRRAGKDFKFPGVAMIASNEPPYYSNFTSGDDRRMVIVPFLNRVESYNRRDLEAEFAPYMAGLLEWVVTMPEAEVHSLVRDTDRYVPQLRANKLNAMCDMNPLAEWLNTRIVLEPSTRTYVGTRDPEKAYKWLYANYYQHAEGTGVKPVPATRFSNLLLDLCTNQLRLDGVTRGRDRNGAFFEGLEIRTDSHERYSLPVTDSVMGCDASVTEGVIIETLINNTFDGCDEKIDIKSLPIQIIDSFVHSVNIFTVVTNSDDENGSSSSHLESDASAVPAGQGFQSVEPSVTSTADSSQDASQFDDIEIDDASPSVTIPAATEAQGYTFKPGDRVRAIDDHETGVPYCYPSTIRVVSGGLATVVNNRGITIENVPVRRLVPWTD